MIRDIVLVALLISFFIVPASADTYEADDVSVYSADAESGSVFTEIFISMPPSEITHAELTSDTFVLDFDLEVLNSYSYTIDIEVEDSLTGATYNSTKTQYHIPGYNPYTSVKIGDAISGECTVVYAGGLVFNGTVQAPTTFVFYADAESNIVYSDREADKLNEENSWSDLILDIIDKVPIVGTYIVSALEFTGAFLSIFFHYAWLVMDNLVLIFVIVETGIMVHMLSKLKSRSKKNKAKRAMAAIEVFVHDNRIAIEFFVNMVSKGIELVYSAVKAIGAWMPFT